MGATVPVHHLQNQIESNDFTVWNQQGVLDGAKNVLSDIKTSESRFYMFGYEPTVDANL